MTDKENELKLLGTDTEDGITLHNLLKTKAQKQEEVSTTLFGIIMFILLVLYILWAIRMNGIFTEIYFG